MKAWLSVFLTVVVMGMAAETLHAAPKDSDEPDTALFYPPEPNLPRLQYLTKFSSSADLSGSSKGFRDFVFGGEEFEDQLLGKPYGVAVHQGAIFVVDSRGNGYSVFDLANGKWRKVTGNGNSAMPKPINITIDKDGTRYLTDTSRDIILVFDARDRFVGTIGEPEQFRPVDVAIAEDRLYVTDIKNNKVHVLDKRSGETLFTFGETGPGPGQLVHPTNLSIGPDNTIYVTDTTNFRVQQFTADGEYIREFGSVGTGIGSFARPKGIDVDRDGRIYVVDAAFNNVQIFDDEARILMFFGGPGEGRGNMNLPAAITINYESLDYFQKYADPDFELEYIVVVTNQFGLNKVAVFGFGSLRD